VKYLTGCLINNLIVFTPRELTSKLRVSVKLPMPRPTSHCLVYIYVLKVPLQVLLPMLRANYTIEVPSQDAVLQFSCGYISENITVGVRSQIDVALTPELKEL